MTQAVEYQGTLYIDGCPNELAQTLIKKLGKLPGYLHWTWAAYEAGDSGRSQIMGEGAFTRALPQSGNALMGKVFDSYRWTVGRKPGHMWLEAAAPSYHLTFDQDRVEVA